jgi:hypothetical protein
MINLGLIDVLLIIVLLLTFIRALRSRSLLLFAVVFVLVCLIELGRFAPGSFTAMQTVVRGIDSINKQLPHIQISPTVTIK